MMKISLGNKTFFRCPLCGEIFKAEGYLKYNKESGETVLEPDFTHSCPNRENMQFGVEWNEMLKSKSNREYVINSV